MSTPLGLVVLAAGASRRLGTCKALVDLSGASPLERLIAAGACLRDAPPLVVTGADDAAIRARLPAGAEVLFNAEWERGRSGGIARAHAARPGHDLVLAPVDCPLIPPEVFAALASAWRSANSPALGWLAPRHGAGPGSYGHPIVVGRALLERLETGCDAPLRHLRAHARPLSSIPVDSPRVLDDLDDPADIARLRKTLGDRTTARD
ncbi:MAG: NTP transferase domain-containing protein [bacterium]|nr:NTP transferase domain-containing protein [bacterium]